MDNTHVRKKNSFEKKLNVQKDNTGQYKKLIE